VCALLYMRGGRTEAGCAYDIHMYFQLSTRGIDQSRRKCINELCLRRSRKISDTGPYRDAEEFNSETGCGKTVSPRLVHTHTHTHIDIGTFMYILGIRIMSGPHLKRHRRVIL